MERFYIENVRRGIALVLALFLVGACFFVQDTEIPAIADNAATTSQSVTMLCAASTVDSIDFYCAEKDTTELIQALRTCVRRTLFAVFVLFVGAAFAIDYSFRSTLLRDRITDKTTRSHQSMIDVLHRKDGSV